jgi:hypothetical protein
VIIIDVDTGYGRLFREQVLGADQGYDLDFCLPPAADAR